MDFKKYCYRIYCDEFGKDAFADELFEKCFDYCKYFCVDGIPVAILFLLPCNIVLNNEVLSAKYVFAVTTSFKHRGKGYMSTLLKELDNSDILFLKTANDNLISFYEKLGYKTFEAIKRTAGEKRVVLEKDFLSLAEKYAIINNEKFVAMYNYKHNIDLNGLSFAYSME